MSQFPAQGALANATYVSNLKQALEDTLAAAKQLPGAQTISNLTIASGSVVPTKYHHLIDTEASAATDDLTNVAITNLPDGAIIFISIVNASRVVVLKHNSVGDGKLLLNGSADITLNAIDNIVVLQRRGLTWQHIGNLGPWSFSIIDGLAATAARTAMGLGAAATQAVGVGGVQAYDATLAALAAVTTAADKIIYATAADTFTTCTLTSFARTLLDDTTQAAMQTTLGLVPGTNVQAYDADTCISDVTKGYSAIHYPTPLAITSASNALAHNNLTCALATCALAENTTVGTPTNMAAGQAGELQVTPSGVYTIAFNTSGWAMADGTAISIALTSGKVTRILWRCNGTKNVIYRVIQEA